MVDIAALKAGATPEDVRQIFRLAETPGHADRWKSVKCPCPAHSNEDKSPSASLKLDLNPRLKCHVTGESWDLIGWLKADRKLGFTGALEALRDQVGGNGTEYRPERKRSPKPKDTECLKPRWDQFARRDEAGEDYLKKRGLGGAVDAGLVRFAVDDAPWDWLEERGMDGWRIVMPMWRGSKLQSFQSRYCGDTPSSGPKTWSFPGHKQQGACFVDRPRPENRPALITEGWADPIAARLALDDSIAVHGLPGHEENGIAERIAAPGRHIYILLDAEDCSRNGAQKIAEELHNRGAIPYVLDLGTGDINDKLLELGSIEALADHLRKLITDAEPWTPHEPESPVPPPRSPKEILASISDFTESHHREHPDEARSLMKEMAPAWIDDVLAERGLGVFDFALGLGKTRLAAYLAVARYQAGLLTAVALETWLKVGEFVEELREAFTQAGVEPIDGHHFSIHWTPNEVCINGGENEHGEAVEVLRGSGVASRMGALAGAMRRSACHLCPHRHCLAHPSFSSEGQSIEGAPFSPAAGILVSTHRALDNPGYRELLTGRLLFIDEAKECLRTLKWNLRRVEQWTAWYRKRATKIEIDLCGERDFVRCLQPDRNRIDELENDHQIALARVRAAEVLAEVLRRAAALRELRQEDGEGSNYPEGLSRGELVALIEDVLDRCGRVEAMEALVLAACNGEKFQILGGGLQVFEHEAKLHRIPLPNIHVLAQAILLHIEAPDADDQMRAYRDAGELQAVTEYHHRSKSGRAEFHLLPGLELPTEPDAIICLDATAPLMPWTLETNRPKRFYQITLPNPATCIFFEAKRATRLSTMRNGRLTPTGAEYLGRKLEAMAAFAKHRISQDVIPAALFTLKATAQEWSTGLLQDCREGLEDRFEFVVWETENTKDGPIEHRAGWHGKHERGVNAANGVKVFISIQDPRPNPRANNHEADRLGLDREEYRRMTMAAKYRQEFGRARATVRPDDDVWLMHAGDPELRDLLGWNQMTVVPEVRGVRKNETTLLAEMVLGEFVGNVGVVAAWLLPELTKSVAMRIRNNCIDTEYDTLASKSAKQRKVNCLQNIGTRFDLELEQLTEAYCGKSRQAIIRAANRVAESAGCRRIKVPGLGTGRSLWVSPELSDDASIELVTRLCEPARVAPPWFLELRSVFPDYELPAMGPLPIRELMKGLPILPMSMVELMQGMPRISIANAISCRAGATTVHRW